MSNVNVKVMNEDAVAKLAATVYGSYGAHAKAAIAFLDQQVPPALGYKYFIDGQEDVKLRDNAMQAVKMAMRREVEKRNVALLAAGEDELPMPKLKIDTVEKTITVAAAGAQKGADKPKTAADKILGSIKSAQKTLAKKINEAQEMGVPVDKELTEAQATSGIGIKEAIQAEVIDIARQNMLTGLDATMARLKPSECRAFANDVLKVLRKHGGISADVTVQETVAVPVSGKAKKAA